MNDQHPGGPHAEPCPRPPAGTRTRRERVSAFVEGAAFQRSIIALIVINAITLGAETSPRLMAWAGPSVTMLDRWILAVFVAEFGLRLYVHRVAFFRDPWSVFDFLVVGVALLPATETFSVLRALRVLRVLRLASAVPRMRRVIEALLSSLPGLGAVVSILGLIFYVAGVMATKLFGEAFPEWFGTLGSSLYSLFQIMTLESWSMGIVRPVMEAYPYAWAFFVPFILIATFTMLNLFIAVVVNAMQRRFDAEQERLENEHAEAAHAEREAMLEEMKGLRADLQAALQRLDRIGNATPTKQGSAS
ncbi:MAG: ion transporter [Gammaproteobacteria bacterium]